jgi:hypothetical protein
MSVADQLGLRGENSELLATTDQGWDHRTTGPRPIQALTTCCGVRDLKSRLGGSKLADAGKLVALECVGVGPEGTDIPAGDVHHEKNGLRNSEQGHQCPTTTKNATPKCPPGGPNRA